MGLEKDIEAASAVRGCQHDLTAGLATRIGHDIAAGFGHITSAASKKHPSLELSKVLAARDDFLTGIAALAEVDAVDRLEIDHLRNELFVASLHDPRDGTQHLCATPDLTCHRCARRLQRLPDLASLIRSHNQQASRPHSAVCLGQPG